MFVGFHIISQFFFFCFWCSSPSLCIIFIMHSCNKCISSPTHPLHLRTYQLQKRRMLECTKSWTKHCRSSTACKMPRRTSNKQTNKQTNKKIFCFVKDIFYMPSIFCNFPPSFPFKTNVPLFTYLWFFLFLFPFLKKMVLGPYDVQFSVLEIVL